MLSFAIIIPVRLVYESLDWLLSRRLLNAEPTALLVFSPVEGSKEDPFSSGAGLLILRVFRGSREELRPEF
jgi:hypothetical protein